MDEAKIIKVYKEGIDSVTKLVKDMSSRINMLNTTITGLRDRIIGLNNEITGLNKEVSDLKETSTKQELRIKELEARVNKDSNNSSKPPSSDGYNKPPKNNRNKSGKSSGGQPGHKGKNLNKVENPDKVIEYNTQENCDCGYNLTDVESKQKTRQVFDIPKPKIRVTEHVICEKTCPGCGKIHKTDFPSGVTQPVQYGDNVHALMNYLTQYQFIPLKRSAEAIKDIVGQKVSQGTLVNSSKRLYENLEHAVETIKEQVTNSYAAHFDETGLRSEGKTKWMHVASTDKLTYYDIHNKRGSKAANDIGILPNFLGTAVHDHWKPYYCFTDCTHAECNSHNLRYLKDIVENYHQDWANKMASLLIEIHRRVKDLKTENKDKMTELEIQTWYDRYHNIIAEGIDEDSEKSPQILNKKGKPKKSKPLRLLLKLKKYDIETLAFMFDFKISFDNNLAERDIRMQKLRQKISGCFRGKNGAATFCRIRSYISTARKNGIGAMDAILKAVKGQPYIPSG